MLQLTESPREWRRSGKTLVHWLSSPCCFLPDCCAAVTKALSKNLSYAISLLMA